MADSARSEWLSRPTRRARPEELERILRLEFPDDVIDRFLSDRTPDARLSYGVAIFTIEA